MNAYELADELDAIAKDWLGQNKSGKLANMLRQQADRIAELEKQGEPVAWMQMHHKDNIPTKFSPVKVWEDDIPLYTTPQTKPLSDEEIEDLAGYAGENPTKSDMIAFARAILRKAQEK